MTDPSDQAGAPSFAIMRVGPAGEERPFVLSEGQAYSLSPLPFDLDGAWLAGGGIDRARDALANGLLTAEEIEDQRLGAPISTPGKIVCIGLNYRDHAEETGAALPTEPVVFMKDPSTVVGPYDPVHIPLGSTKTDWEVELGVVIGAKARYLDSPDSAAQCIAGYVMSHDVSEREFQLERGGQWDKGKSCETFNPLGPWLVPAAEIKDPHDLKLRLSVNGVQRQHGSTSNMIFDVHHIIWYLSQFMVLNPGDLINTGTPAGVALGLPGHPYLCAGDEVELSVTGLGTARQTMIPAPWPVR